LLQANSKSSKTGCCYNTTEVYIVLIIENQLNNYSQIQNDYFDTLFMLNTNL